MEVLPGGSNDRYSLYVDFVFADGESWPMKLATFDTRGITDPRHASIVQKDVLYLLLRTGVLTTLYYLDSVQKQELAEHRTIVVPLPLVVARNNRP